MFFLYILLTFSIFTLHADTVNVITGEYVETDCDLDISETVPFQIMRCYHADSLTQPWKFNHPNIFQNNTKAPDGAAYKNSLTLYQYDCYNRLEAIKVYDKNLTENFHQAAITYGNYEGMFSCIIESSCGKLIYQFRSAGPLPFQPPFFLDTVIFPNGERTNYVYCTHPDGKRKLISQKRSSNGQLLINEYDDAGLVKLQKIIFDNGKEIQEEFFYHQDHTVVQKSLRKKMIYRHQDQHIIAIEFYEDNQLTKIEKFVWNGSKMVSREIYDSNHQLLDSLSFTYNEQGDLIYNSSKKKDSQKIEVQAAISFSNIWDDFCSNLNHFFGVLVSFENFSLERDLNKEIGDSMIAPILGENFMSLSGYYTDPLFSGVIGNGELLPKVRVSAINGLLNMHEHWLSAVKMISNTHGGINIHYVFDPTAGWTGDAVKGFMAKCGYVSTVVELLVSVWKDLIDQLGGANEGGMILHYAHSMGGTNTGIARDLMTPEEQKMIKVITIGSSSILPNKGFKSVVNYMSNRDFVNIMDPAGYIAGLTSLSNVIYIGTFDGIPLVDHLLSMETYSRLIEVLGKQFQEEHDL